MGRSTSGAEVITASGTITNREIDFGGRWWLLSFREPTFVLRGFRHSEAGCEQLLGRGYVWLV